MQLSLILFPFTLRALNLITWGHNSDNADLTERDKVRYIYLAEIYKIH